MNRQAQALLLVLVGAFALRLGWTDEHLIYVRGWVRWPLMAAGLALLALAAGVVFSDQREAEEPAPRTAWLLFLPFLVLLLVSPPPLGADFAERSAATPYRDPGRAVSGLRPLPDVDPVRLDVADFYVRARYDAGASLVDRRVELTGFVSKDPEGNWYVTRFQIACCAADAIAVRVRVDGADSTPERDSWVRVTGSWVDGSGARRGSGAPAVEAASVEPAEVPRSPYE